MKATRVMSAYVAGSSLERARCRAAAGLLEAHGFRITFRWFDEPDVPEVELPRAERERLREVCLDAAKDADVFLLCVPEPPNVTVGAWFELAQRLEQLFPSGYGYFENVALAGAKPTTLFAEGAKHYATDEDAVLALAGGRP